MRKTSVREEPIGLLGVGAYLPARIMENAEWTRYVDTSDEWIVARTGIRRRRVAAEEETTVDLAVNAARSALERTNVRAEDLAEIIVATDTPHAASPDTAAFVQHRLGAREIPSYDLAGSGCAGFVQALDVARARVLLGQDPILVIGVELLTRRMDWSDRNTAVLFGDGAGAAVVSRGPRVARILGAVAGTDGSQVGILGIAAGGRRVVMNGKEVFREAVRRMTAASRRVMEQVGLTASDVALTIPHQANLRIVQAVARALDVPDEKVMCTVQEYGNIGSASIPVALWEAENAGRINPGDTVLLTSFGAGFHWAAMLLRYA